MTTTKPCARKTLAAGSMAMVEQCTCGAVHLTIGAVTLRLAPSAISSLSATLNDAACRLMAEQVLSLKELQGEILS